jgi:hypothetical protein
MDRHLLTYLEILTQQISVQNAKLLDQQEAGIVPSVTSALKDLIIIAHGLIIALESKTIMLFLCFYLPFGPKYAQLCTLTFTV